MSGGFTTGITQEGPWKAQEDYLKRGFARAESAYKGGPAPYFPGKTLAGFDPAQQAAQAATLGYAQGPRPAAQQELAERQMGRTYDWAARIPEVTAQGVQAMGPTVTDLMAGRVDRGAGTPYGDLESAYKESVISQLTNPTTGVLPGIRSGLVNYQPGGSTRGNMLQQQAIVDAMTKGYAQPVAQMYGQAYQQAQAGRLPAAQAIQQGYGQLGGAYGQAAQTGLAGMQQYPSLMAAPMAMYGAMGDVGAQRRALAQESINQAMQKYEYGATAPQVALQNYMAGISGEYGGTQAARPSALQSAGQLGSLMSGLGMIG
jgi:hypothetical protein